MKLVSVFHSYSLLFLLLLLLLSALRLRVGLGVRVRKISGRVGGRRYSWRASFGFSACIGTMNPKCVTCSIASEASCGSWRAPHGFDAVHWDHATSDSLESRLQPVRAVRAA